LRAHVRDFFARAQVFVQDLHAVPSIEFREGGGDTTHFVAEAFVHAQQVM
jgi:hypothetical protein